MRLARNFIAALIIGLPSLAWGQSAVLQGGSFTPGHVPMYVGQGTQQPIVQDSGTAAGGGPGLGLSEIGITARGTGTPPYAGQGSGPFGTNGCFYDAPTTNAAGYHYFCLSANAQGGGLMAYGNGGAAAALPFNFIVNGATYQFPFTVGGITGPSSSTVNDAACWNNTSGTLLKDCGAFVTVGGNNTWSGTNNFTGTFQWSSVTQTFPGSGNIVGTSDTQTLTNKNINASEINSGTFPATVMPGLTGAVTSSAGSVATTLSAGVVANSNFAAAGAANTLKGAAVSTAVTDLAVPSCSTGSSALQWVTGTGFQCGSVSANTAGWGVDLTTGVFSISTVAPPFSYDVPVNMGLAASVSASALTISLKTAAGTDASASSPVLIPFRSTTAATGTVIWTKVTGALSIVIPSAATLGTLSSNVPFRIWIFAAYNGGTPELGVAVCSSTSTIYPCAAWETTLKTTVTINGFATSSGAIYSTAGVSNDAVRIIGYCSYESGLATAGSWASACTTLQPFGPGVKKPGDVVQSIYNLVTGASSVNSTSYVETSLTQAITPTSTVNLIRVDTQWNGLSGSALNALCRLSRGTSPTLIGSVSTPFGIATSGDLGGSNSAVDAPGTASSVTYALYCSASASSWTFNYYTAAVITLEEIMGALDAPANDNGTPQQSMVG